MEEAIGGSIRQKMIELLRRGPTTLKELAGESGLKERETADHLGHAVRSLRPEEKLLETPAECLACGFSFRKRDRFRKPSRCPRCKSERIEPAHYWVQPK